MCKEQTTRPCLKVVSACTSSQALALEAHERDGSGGDSLMEDSHLEHGIEARMFYEITVASVDQPKLLSRLSEALVRVWECRWWCDDHASSEGLVKQ